MSRDHGVTEEKLLALASFADADVFSPVEKAALHYAVAMTTTPQIVPDDVFEQLRSLLDQPQIVELTAAIAWENYRARFNHAFGIESAGFTEGTFCPMPERPTLPVTSPSEM